MITKQLHTLGPKEQVDAIVHDDNALEVAQSLPAESLLLTIKKVGLDDSLELLELLSPEQVQTLLDLDAWQHDALDNRALGEWLSSLQSANPDTAFAQMREADIELLTLMLRECAEIFDLIENDDPIIHSDLVMYTSDKHYALAFKTDEAHEAQSLFIKGYLEEMMGRNFLEAIRLIESARFESDAVLMEDARRLRDGRLQDLGFLPMDEHLSILAFVDIDKAKPGHIPLPEGAAHTTKQLSYKLPTLVDRPFLREALLGLSHASLEQSWGYIVTVANRVHMAQHGKYSDLDAVNESARYTLNFIEMALSYLSKGSLSEAKTVFLSYAPQELFKMGHSLVLRLQRDFLKLRKHPTFLLANTSLMRLETPLLEVMRGVLQPEPLFYAGLTDPKRVDYRSFESVKDVAQVSAAISESAFRCALLGPKGFGYEENGKQQEHSFAVLLATYFAHLLIDNKGSFEPLSAKQLTTLFARLEKTPSGRRWNAADRTRCVSATIETAQALVGLVGVRNADEAEARATQYATLVIGLVESELAKISDEAPEPSLITTLSVEHI